MMTRRIGTVAAGLALAFSAAACNNGLTDLNQDPNNPATAPSGPVFTRAVEQTAAQWLGTGFDLRGTEFIAQHLAEVQYPDEDRYQRLQSPNTTTYFDLPYERQLADLNGVIQSGFTDNRPGIYGPAIVMMAWNFADLTDTWGDVPFSQALKGDSGSIQPAYDKQQDIYRALMDTLTFAANAMANDPADDPGLGSADPIYGGDLAEWQKFANSLHARLALRLVNVDQATATAELTKAFTAPGGLITTNADNAQLNWPGDGVFNNPWADNFKSRDDHRMSQTLMNIMLANNDPRIPVYAQPTQANASKYAGMPNGLINDSAGTYLQTASRPGAIFYAQNGGTSQPSYFMTAAEVLFIQAEAAARGLGGLAAGQAQTFYNSAITASLEQWGVTSAGSFLTQPGVAFAGPGAAGLKQIAVQKWIALYTDGLQAWAEWRRTCQPQTIQAGPAAIVDFVPRRLEYSQTEYTVNSTNMNDAISDQGADNFGTRMYWDTQPATAPTYVDAATCGP